MFSHPRQSMFLKAEISRKQLSSENSIQEMQVASMQSYLCSCVQISEKRKCQIDIIHMQQYIPLSPITLGYYVGQFTTFMKIQVVNSVRLVCKAAAHNFCCTDKMIQCLSVEISKLNTTMHICETRISKKLNKSGSQVLFGTSNRSIY